MPNNFPKIIFDKYDDMARFIEIVEKSKVDRFTIHARIAILAGLSAKENRNVPPLRYEDVYRLKNNFPYLNIEINGGIKTLAQMEKHLAYVDGVMLGRVAYDNPFILTEVDKLFKNGDVNNISRKEVIEGLITFVEKIENNGGSGYEVLRHTLGLFYGVAGSKKWRQLINPPWQKGYSGRDILEKALRVLPTKSLNN